MEVNKGGADPPKVYEVDLRVKNGPLPNPKMNQIECHDSKRVALDRVKRDIPQIKRNIRPARNTKHKNDNSSQQTLHKWILKDDKKDKKDDRKGYDKGYDSGDIQDMDGDNGDIGRSPCLGRSERMRLSQNRKTEIH